MSGPRGSLILDDLDLMDPFPQGAAFRIVGLSGTAFGNAEPELRSIPSFLTDGEIEEIDRFGNVQHEIVLKLEGPHSAALAEAEAMLEARLYKRTTLEWTPPGGWAPTSVFEVLESWSAQTFDDEWDYREAKGDERRFTVTIVRRPWVRSLDPVVIEAQGFAPDPVDPTTTALSACTTTAGWSTRSSGTTVTASGGHVINSHPTLPKKTIESNLSLEFTLSSPTDLIAAGTPLIAIDWWRDGGHTLTYPTATVVRPGGELVPLSVVAQAAAGTGLMRYWYRLPAGLVDGLLFGMRVRGPGDVPRRFWIDQLEAYSHVPSIGTGGQQFRTLTVPGTAPTEASIQVAHETGALGDVLIWTGQTVPGYQPPCSPWRTTGGLVVPTAGTVSGTWRPLDAGARETYDIPIDALPEGTYAFLAILKGDAPGAQLVEWDVSTLVGSVEHATDHGFASRSLTTSAAIYDLGTLSLPTMPAGSDAHVRIELYSAGACQVDEAWVLNLTDGRMSLVSCGTGTPATGGASNRLWIESPTVETRRPRYYVGTNANRGDRRHAAESEITSLTTHELLPGDNNVFTATTGVTKAAVTADLFPRWRHNAGL